MKTLLDCTHQTNLRAGVHTSPVEKRRDGTAKYMTELSMQALYGEIGHWTMRDMLANAPGKE